MNHVIRHGNPLILSIALPADEEDGTYSNWHPKAQFRKKGNDMPSGFVFETTDITWVDSITTKELTLTVKDTSKWPTGVLEFDVVLTSPGGQTYRTEKQTVEIQKGITPI